MIMFREQFEASEVANAALQKREGLKYAPCRRKANDRIHFSYGAATDKVETLVRSHPVNTAVTVYYDPDDSSNSVLLPGFASMWWLPLASSILFIVWTSIIHGEKAEDALPTSSSV